MAINGVRAVELTSGDSERWRATLPHLWASQLNTLSGELESAMRHPSVAFRPAMVRIAGERVEMVKAELQRRWRAVWDLNETLSDRLDKVYGMYT
ncbi:hypothetical protein [Mycobacterium phage WXIN]|nr:hypothetical protein [Mycobacterium phage WXIN]